jgi:hypothetical protein
MSIYKSDVPEYLHIALESLLNQTRRPDEIVIVDFKYGMHRVPATSLQLRIYALGACEMFSALYDFSSVRMVVYQPRISNYSKYTLSSKDLVEWAETTLKPAAEMALHGEGDFASGAWCRFCKAKAVCRKRAEENLRLARYDFAPADTLDETEISAVLDVADELASWVSDVKEYALSQALQGVRYPGYKVVEGRSKRVFTDTKAVVDTAVANGYTDLYKRQLITLTEFEKMMGKKRFAELLGEYVAKPPGKLALVPEDDPRPPVDLNNNPDQEFAVLTDGV